MRPTNTLSKTLRDATTNDTKNHDTSPAADAKATPSNRSWQTRFQQSSAHWTMAFKNEVVSDADIDRYNLPFPKGEGRWWTRDAERDYYLWGGLVGNLAYDDMREGRFHLYINSTIYWIKIQPGEGSTSLNDHPFIINWKSIARIEPNVTDKDKYNLIVTILKEALMTYGYEGQDDDWVTNSKVVFGF